MLYTPHHQQQQRHQQQQKNRPLMNGSSDTHYIYPQESFLFRASALECVSRWFFCHWLLILVEWEWERERDAQKPTSTHIQAPRRAPLESFKLIEKTISFFFLLLYRSSWIRAAACVYCVHIIASIRANCTVKCHVARRRIYLESYIPEDNAARECVLSLCECGQVERWRYNKLSSLSYYYTLYTVDHQKLVEDYATRGPKDMRERATLSNMISKAPSCVKSMWGGGGGGESQIVSIPCMITTDSCDGLEKLFLHIV